MRKIIILPHTKLIDVDIRKICAQMGLDIEKFLAQELKSK